MACIKPDGTLTSSARMIMNVMKDHDQLEEVSQLTGIPLYLVRVTARELVEAGLAEEHEGHYHLTADGLQRLSAS
jgi:predicted transcriptional regulator